MIRYLLAAGAALALAATGAVGLGLPWHAVVLGVGAVACWFAAAVIREERTAASAWRSNMLAELERGMSESRRRARGRDRRARLRRVRVTSKRQHHSIRRRVR